MVDLNIKTTKSVWVFPAGDTSINPGESLADEPYRKFIQSLKVKGFEIGLHNVCATTSTRERIREGLTRMASLFGPDPLAHCNHIGCADNIYWGESRLGGWRRHVHRALARTAFTAPSRGHVPGDPSFWGDLCHDRVRYVRSFVFDELDVLRVCPETPYHNPAKPFVNFWFCSSDGGNVSRFLRNLTPERVDRLVEAGGVCIVYSHFAAGFADGGMPEKRFRRIMENLAARPGWFAPVSTVLDHLRAGATPAERTIPPDALRRLETRWLFSRMRDRARKVVRKRLPRRFGGS